MVNQGTTKDTKLTEQFGCENFVSRPGGWVNNKTDILKGPYTVIVVYRFKSD